MCRIAGIISNRLSTTESKEKVKVMCDVLRHGGPDDEGQYTNDKNLVFGHRRLSIIDLSKNGHQPMADPHQNIWITFNGEIYNYLALKEELLCAGARFNSDTDTEVIIQAYLKWGTLSFSKLRGIFAFALYDKSSELTYLVRDTAAIKPLYYHIADDQLSFASEVKALKAAGVSKECDANWQVRFLAFGHIPEPYTTLKDVYSLPKGHFLCWNNCTGTHTINLYDRPIKEPYIINRHEARVQLRNAFKLAINRQLIADAEIGVFLSGGIDSSLITLLANDQKAQQLKTISIVFDEKAYDERSYQQLVLQKIQGEKFTHLVKQKDFEESFPRILESMDMPTTDGINTWFISKYAHQDGLKAVLSGLGADELYGGYPSFNRIKYIKYLKNMPVWPMAMAVNFAPDHYKKIKFLQRDHPLAHYLALRGLFTPDNISALLDIDVKEIYDILFAEPVATNVAQYDKEYAAWLETNLYMQNQLLRDTDVMSMSHGLEVRVPFLDEDFQQLTRRISPEIRFAAPAKHLLVDTFADLLPPAITDRPKMGFTFPLQQWMQQHPEISNSDLYRSKAAKSLIKEFKADKVHWSKTFALYQLQQHE